MNEDTRDSIGRKPGTAKPNPPQIPARGEVKMGLEQQERMTNDDCLVRFGDVRTALESAMAVMVNITRNVNYAPNIVLDSGGQQCAPVVLDGSLHYYADGTWDGGYKPSVHPSDSKVEELTSLSQACKVIHGLHERIEEQETDRHAATKDYVRLQLRIEQLHDQCDSAIVERDETIESRKRLKTAYDELKDNIKFLLTCGNETADEIKRLRMELRFYADPENWMQPDKIGVARANCLQIYEIGWTRAENALKPKEDRLIDPLQTLRPGVRMRGTCPLNGPCPDGVTNCDECEHREMPETNGYSTERTIQVSDEELTDHEAAKVRERWDTCTLKKELVVCCPTPYVLCHKCEHYDPLAEVRRKAKAKLERDAEICREGGVPAETDLGDQE